MSGYTRDIFWGETYTKEEDKSERWCGTDTQVLPALSVDGFRLLRDRSFLYSPKNQMPKYKLNAIDAELLTSNINVNYFYCEPNSDE